MVTVNREFWTLPAFGGISLAFAAWLHASVLWFLFYACLSCMVLAVVYRWRNWDLQDIARSFNTSPKNLQSGSDIQIRLHLEVASRLPWPWLELRDNLPPSLAKNVVGQAGGHMVWVDRGKGAWISYIIKNIPRGIHRWESVEVSSGDPLGLVAYQGRVAASSQLVVYPRTINLNAWQFFPRRVDGTASSRNSLSHDLSQLVGIREYQPGDRLSLIHWKSSAKSNQLHSKEFAPLLTDSSLVVLDCSAQAWQQGYDPAFEEAVTAAASLVKAAWLQRIPVRFHGNQGKQLEQLTVASQTDFSRLLLHLAAIAPTGGLALSQSIFNQLLTQGSNVVIITPVVCSKLQRMLYRLAARGNIVTVIRVDGNPAKVSYERPRASGAYNLFNIARAEDLVSGVQKRDVRP